jgi:hypothetical protein
VSVYDASLSGPALATRRFAPCRDRADDDVYKNASVSDPELIPIPPADSEIEDVFTGYGLRSDDNMDDNSVSISDDDSDTEEINHQDILLTSKVRVVLHAAVPLC